MDLLLASEPVLRFAAFGAVLAVMAAWEAAAQGKASHGQNADRP